MHKQPSDNIRETFDWLRANGFMVKTHRPMWSAQEHTRFSRGYDRGNYGNAYESQDWETWSARNRFDRASRPAQEGMLLGFFSSYEIDEIGDECLADEVAYLRVRHDRDDEDGTAAERWAEYEADIAARTVRS